MKRKLTATTLVIGAALVAVAFAAGGVTKGSAGTLDGAGSSFVFPLVSTWTPVYDAATGVHVNYNPIGSGGGISAISNRSVDFGASDAPLTTDQFAGCHGCVQIPWALSATSVAYNVNGVVPHLRMSGPV
ncbi:MAG: phosphate transport system substrate-binding protein, partial [Gaiellaceae bacterium]|nr:phosphate transport system substrate-binding protein [Gaiellaceae bacterium]